MAETFLSPDDLADVMSTPEFIQLPFAERQSLVERGLQESSQFVQQERGGWTPETWKQFGEAANAARQYVTESETLLEKTGSVLKQAGGAVVDALAITGTQAVGLSPVLPTAKGGVTFQVPGETSGPMLLNRAGALTGGMVSNLVNDVTPVRDTLAEIRAGLDEGAFFKAEGGFSTWLDTADAAMQEAAKAYHGDASLAEQNTLLRDPENAQLLASYAATRDPQAWTALEKRLQRTPLDFVVAADKQKLETESKLGQALKPESRPFIAEASDPAEVAGNLLGLGMGAKALARGASLGERAKALGKGLAGEMASEQISASIDDPRLSLAERLQVAKDSIISAAGLMAAGAAPGAIARTVEAFTPSAPATDGTASMPPAAAPMADAGASISPLPGIAQRAGTVDVPPLVPGLEVEDLGPLTAADVAEFEPTPAPPPPAPTPRQPILQGVPDLAPRMRESSLNAEPLMEGDVITDLRVPRSPAAIAESQRAEKERQAQVAKLRMLDNQAKGVPMIADSPTGSRDILDWANENPIFLPPGFSADRKLPEYEALGRNPLPPYWRQFVASGKQGGNPDDIASRAYDKGLIDAPTADAYLEKLQEAIGARNQYRVQFSQRDKALAQEEKRVVDFEKTQDKLAKKPQAQQVPFEDIVPGDTMTIDGEQAVVRNVEHNEDGYLTNVVIEDGKRFGLMQFDPQTRGGLLVDEFKPRGLQNFQQPPTGGQSAQPGSASVTPAGSSPAAATLARSTASTPATGPVAAPAASAAGAMEQTNGNGAGASPAMPPARRQVNQVNDVNLEALNAELQMAGGLTNFRVDGTTAGFANAQILNEALDLVAQGFNTFANWSAQMIRRFGEGIRAVLADVWDNVRRNSQLGAVMNPLARGPLRAPESGMASASGAAQANEPSPGGLSEALPRNITLKEESPSGELDAETVREWADIWSDLSDKGTAKSTKSKIIKALARMAEGEGWNWGWQKDANSEFFPYIVYFDTPQGQVSFHTSGQMGNPYKGVWSEEKGASARVLPSLFPKTSLSNKKGTVTILGQKFEFSQRGKTLILENQYQDFQTYRFNEAGADWEFESESTDGVLSSEQEESPDLEKLFNWLNNATAPVSQSGGLSSRYNTAVLTQGASAQMTEAQMFGGTWPQNGDPSSPEVNPESSRAAGGTQGFKNLDPSGRTAGFLNTEILAEAEQLIREGFTTFANWSKAMVTRFGRGIQEFLASIWRMVKDGAGDALMNYLQRTGGMKSFVEDANGPPRSPAGATIPEGMAESQSRFARPEQADRLYDVQSNEVMQQQAVAWLDANGVEAGLAAMEANQPPEGLRIDHMPALGETVIQRLMEATKQPGEAAQLMAEGLLDRAGIAWQGAMSQEAGRTLQQRAAANARLLPIAPVLAAKRILVDRADAVMDKRFEGGAEGAVAAVKDIDTKASTEASAELTAQLEGEPEAPELGDNPEVSPVSDARIAELEQQMLAMREQMVRAETQAEGTLAQTTSTWQKIMGVLQGASSRKSALLTGAKGRLAALRKSAMARKAARRAEGRLSANPVEDFADDALIGASILAEGLVEFTNWSQALLREIGYRSGQDLRKLYAEASKKYLEALEAEKAAPTKTKGTPKQRAAREKINRAQRTAQNILDSLARRYSDPPIFDEGQRKVNAMRELYKERVRTGMAEAEFVQRAQALGANEGTSGILWEASKLEIDAREMMALEKSRAGLAAYLQKDSPALRKKIAPGMTWVEIFTDMPSAQKARQKEIYRRLMRDDRLKALNQAERLQLTNELDRAWQRERRKVFKRELQKAGVLGEKDASDRQKVVNGLPKLLRMINLGMFSSAVWREAVAPEYGLRMLTATDTAQLRTLAEEAWKLPEGVLRNQKLRDLLNGIQKKTGASWVEVLNSYWTAAVLSGLRTQFDTWLSAVNGMGTNLLQIGGLLARGQGKAAIDAHAAWWRGLIEGVRESGQILWRGDTSYLKHFGADLKKALDGETSVTPVPLGENLWRNGNTFQKYGLAPVMMFTGRLMAAADHVNNTATTQGAIAVARALNPEIYAGRVGFTDAERASARAQALREVTGGGEPKTGAERATISARARELLNGLVKPADYAAASEIGDMAAFQNDPTGLFGVLYGAMKQGLGSIQRGLGEVSADVTANRFARVAAGLMAGSLHGITGTRFMRFGFNFGAELTRYLPGSYVLGKAGFYGRDVSRMQQELLLGKNMVGLMLGSTLAALFLSGDDEEEGWQIEGDWSTLNPQEAKERMTAGLERMTLWKRDAKGQVQRVSYKQWPTMGLFSVVGGMLDEKRYKPAQWANHGTAGHLLRGLATGYVQVKNVSAVRNLVEIFGEPSFSSDAVTGAMDKMVKTSTNFAGGLVPTLVKDADIWSDPRNFKPEGVAEQMLRSVPIARRFVNDGRPQLNLLGEEVKLQRSPWSRAYTSVENGEAHRVLGALMARGLSLPLPSDQVHVIQNGVKVPLETLGREAVWKYEKAVGTTYKDWLSLEGSDLLALPTATAAKVIERRANAIKARARAQVTR